jgi:membrane protein
MEPASAARKAKGPGIGALPVSHLEGGNGARAAGAYAHDVAPASVFATAWHVVKDAVSGFIDHDDLSRGASIAYFTLFAIVPVLLVVIAVAGLVFGREAAQGAVVAQLSGLMGTKTADALQDMIRSASQSTSGGLAAWIGVGAILLAASGVFGEVQSGLNGVWQAKPRSSGLTRLMRVRLASLGLVLTSGFLLMVSLAVSAGLAAWSKLLLAAFPAAGVALQVVDFLTSGLLMTGMFAAIYKILPDTPIAWRDVIFGSLLTTGLFAAGKYAIALYVSQSDVASSFGAASALIVLLLWIFFSAQIFLLGAEFTRAFAQRCGSHADGAPEKTHNAPVQELAGGGHVHP